MTANDRITEVNPYFLEQVFQLAKSQAVVAAEDIRDNAGHLLLAKGRAIDGILQEKLSTRSLHKPLETVLSVYDEMTKRVLLAAAEHALRGETPFARMIGRYRRDLLATLTRTRVHGAAALLLSALHSSRPNLFSHSVRVSLLSIAIGLELNLDRSALDRLCAAGLMHDIGIMYLEPPDIARSGLAPRTRWDDAILHCELSRAAVAQLTDYPASVAEAVGEHHERFDGSGFPHGLRGAKISLLGQILGAAESSVEKLNGPRPYDVALTLRLISGEYPPAVVSAVTRMARAAFTARIRRPSWTLEEGLRAVATLSSIFQDVKQICTDVVPPELSAPTRQFIQRTRSRLSNLLQALRSVGCSESCGERPTYLGTDADGEIAGELEVVATEIVERIAILVEEIRTRSNEFPDLDRQRVHSLLDTLTRCTDVCPDDPQWLLVA